MKAFRKILCLALSAIMVLSLSACVKEEKIEENDDEQTIVLNVISETTSYEGLQEGWAAKILKDKFNISLNFIYTSFDNDEFIKELDNGVDIVTFGDEDTCYKYAVQNGKLLDFDKTSYLADYGKNISAYEQSSMARNREATKTITNGESDACYGFYSNISVEGSHSGFYYTWDIRWDLYKQLGYPKVNNLDDLVTLFADMKKICPTDEHSYETYALSIWSDWDGSLVMYAKTLAMAYWGYDDLDMGLYDPATGQFHDALEENGPYLTALKFLNNLYREGLLDPASRTQTYADANAKIKAGGAFFSIFNYAGSVTYNTEEHMAAGKYMNSMPPADATPLTYSGNTAGGSYIYSIASSTKYPEKCMEVLDYLVSPEGYLTMTIGPKGIMWDYDENQMAYLTDLGYEAVYSADGVEFEMDGEKFVFGGSTDGWFNLNVSAWSASSINPDDEGKQTFDYGTWKSTSARQKTDYAIEQDWIDFTGFTTANGYLNSRNYKVAAYSYVSGAKSDEFQKTWSSVSECIVKYSWDAIYAESDGEFNYLISEMCKSAEALGYAECKAWCESEAALRFQQEGAK